MGAASIELRLREMQGQTGRSMCVSHRRHRYTVEDDQKQKAKAHCQYSLSCERTTVDRFFFTAREVRFLDRKCFGRRRRRV
jgi:hypothetical protein